MMEVEFRGKRVDFEHGEVVFGDWVYGYYYDNACPSLLINGKHINAEYILVKDSYGDVPCLGNLGSPTFFQVLPETVGRFTGFTDKKGKKVYEGDIVDCWSEGKNARGTVQQRKDGLWIIYPSWQKNIMWGLCPDMNGGTTVEVIGNIFDKESDNGY